MTITTDRSASREHVDPSAITKVVEAHLDPDVPPEPGHEFCDVALKCRMRSIDEPIELFPAPPHLEVDRCAERRDDAVDVPHR